MKRTYIKPLAAAIVITGVAGIATRPGREQEHRAAEPMATTTIRGSPADFPGLEHAGGLLIEIDTRELGRTAARCSSTDSSARRRSYGRCINASPNTHPGGR